MKSGASLVLAPPVNFGSLNLAPRDFDEKIMEVAMEKWGLKGKGESEDQPGKVEMSGGERLEAFRSIKHNGRLELKAEREGI